MAFLDREAAKKKEQLKQEKAKAKEQSRRNKQKIREQQRAAKRATGDDDDDDDLEDETESEGSDVSDSDSDDDDDDDDYGPALPTSSAHQARQSEAAARAVRAAAESAAKGPQRDDWMLAPPTAGGYKAPDPTKLKARKFNSGPRSGAGGGGGSEAAAGGISSIWTETPEQKRKRLEDAVLGRDAGAAAPRPPPTQSREDEERAAQIRDNLERARGPSLYAVHQARDGGKGGRIEEEEDDPSKRGFDREKDMKIGGRIGAAQRKELLNKAADFGGRFSKGKFL